MRKRDTVSIYNVGGAKAVRLCNEMTATAIIKTDMNDFLIDFVPRDELRTKVARSNNDGYIPLTIKPRDSNMEPPFPIDASQTAALYHEEVDHHGNIFGTITNHRRPPSDPRRTSSPDVHALLMNHTRPSAIHIIRLANPIIRSPQDNQINEGHQMVNDAHSHESDNMEDVMGRIYFDHEEEQDQHMMSTYHLQTNETLD
ncbi:hypothetical protein PROFUN_11459 [Planoprotostelium fungivorum]|uniref:Uncharacterized protein n=1 Tax=Planoprotostelium fungivorum TaxID=1890364 RepID=A0A2P6N4X1_9EUKA|nr:hypothetical protein PROFUN_11459 [Planoprotostelium fungivorum]